MMTHRNNYRMDVAYNKYLIIATESLGNASFITLHTQCFAVYWPYLRIVSYRSSGQKNVVYSLLGSGF